ncbi:hypothetical protein V6N12_050485 [Hibiscus sabdariffa]|uniref:Uncharacterized protein n=1 Tax=Hibiscus sabdariffa TaxID=183260 RepID=A0ABR2GDM9_9ROSI
MEESTPTRSIIQFCATRRGESHSTRAKNKPESHSQAALGDVGAILVFSLTFGTASNKSTGISITNKSEPAFRVNKLVPNGPFGT